jgi:peptidyl-tRNA hydrolase
MFTLRQTNEDPTPFDRKRNVGLHHVVLKMDTKKELIKLHQTLEESDLVHFEFSPEPLREGPAQHMICTEPSSIRIEFIWGPE